MNNKFEWLAVVILALTMFCGIGFLVARLSGINDVRFTHRDICMDGETYIAKLSGNRGFLVQKLDTSGNPIPCKE